VAQPTRLAAMNRFITSIAIERHMVKALLFTGLDKYNPQFISYNKEVSEVKKISEIDIQR
jgi:hypothetical protein